MNEYEKNIIRLIEAHEKAEKKDLIRNINRAIKLSEVSWFGKNEWICKVTNSPMGTVCTWFTHSKCRAVNKIPLYAMCKIAVALRISVWKFFETEEVEKMEGTAEPAIDRRGKLYWHLRRNEAEQLWNGKYGRYGVWTMQSKAVQREFLDKLYLERLAQQAEEANG